MSAFRVLRACSDGDSDDTEVEIGGGRWMLVEYAMPPLDAADYVCISYAWGPGRVPHVLDERELMPERTPRVVKATQTAFAPQAMWVDALCVPMEEPDRSRCLRSLGAIYSVARMVVVVLSGPAEAVIDELLTSDQLSEEALHILEDDDWVSRAWTYQELVDAQAVEFISESGRGSPVPATRLFDAVGKSMETFRKTRGLDQWRLRELSPRLDALESLIGDWSISAYIERSAFRVMGAMANRVAVHPDEVFYAMIGAITTESAADNDELTLPAAEYFMRVCERKGDFSFVYSSARRGRPSWRPVTGLLPAVLAWHSDGAAQTGALVGQKLQLNDMFLAEPDAMVQSARAFVQGALPALGVDRGLRTDAVPPAIAASLRRAGFHGCGAHVELASGYFFPVHDLPVEREWTVAVSTDIFWTFGAPALLISARAATHRVVDVGVFIGRAGDKRIALDLE